MDFIKRTLSNKILSLILKNKHKLFNNSLKNPRKTLEDYLLNNLNKNKNSIYGNKYQFNKIKNINDFREKVPLINYEDIIEFIEEMKLGKENILFTEKIEIFEKTSGSSNPSKYIPINKSLLNEISLSLDSWIYEIYKRYPSLLNSTSYWAISPKLENEEWTRGRIRVGFTDDSEYFSKLESIFLKNIFSVDLGVAKLKPDEWRIRTLTQLLSDENLGLISIWSPTFLTILLEYIENNRNEIISKLKLLNGKRLNFLTSILSSNSSINYELIWPKLKIISTWGDGPSALFISELRKYFPTIEIEKKGLLMTEGIISIPVNNPNGNLLSLPSHFYEFLPISQNTNETLLPTELKIGEEYIPIITTGGGLYRYNTHDIIEITDIKNDIPIFTFKGRDGDVSDLFGEKLNEIHILNIIENIKSKFHLELKFALLAPSLTLRPHYVLYIEPYNHIDISNDITTFLEESLSENHHYSHCRNLKQLDQVKIITVVNAKKAYLEKILETKSIKHGNIKPKVLCKEPFWDEVFNKD